MGDITRRTVLTGALGSALLLGAGCSQRSDIDAVKAAMQAAVERVPEWVSGQVQYQDRSGPGTFIAGVFTVAGTTREDAVTGLAGILQAAIGVYLEQPNTRTALVTPTAYPEHDSTAGIGAVDVLRGSDGGYPTSEDLAEHFGLS